MTRAAVSFTPDQQRAVDTARPLADACVVAGPGSGKTTVLVEYYRRLVEGGADPLRILAITFTEKAAGNMRKKVAEAFADTPSLRARLERAWVSTVHGFCARLLKENAIFAGVDPEFSVASERASWRLQQESIAAALESLFTERPAQVRALLRGLALAGKDIETALLNAYDAMRGAGIPVVELPLLQAPVPVTVEQVVWAIHELRAQQPVGWSGRQTEALHTVLDGCAGIIEAARGHDIEALLRAINFPLKLTGLKPSNATYDTVRRLKEPLLHDVEYLLIQQFYADERDLLREALTRFDRLYRDAKRHAGLLDFADLEEFAVRLLAGNSAARDRLRAQFDHVLMDEFQDTNGQQARLLELLRSEDRFYAVGDINQSIFGFRHADPEVFRDYRDEIERSGKHLVELTHNFRSRASILAAVETVADQAEGIVGRPLVAGRQFATAKQYCVELACLTGPDAAAALETEARWVAGRIVELLATGEHSFRDVAVLVRNTEVLGAFTAVFEAAQIPHVVNRGRGFYDTREVRDLVHLLRSIANPRDEASLATVLRSPLVHASDEALLVLRGLADNLAYALVTLSAEHAPLFEAGDFAALTRFRDRLHQWRIRREAFSFDRLLLDAIDECGYASESTRASANVSRFLADAREAAAHMSLDQFVEELALAREENPREAHTPPDDESDTVRLMTVHSAKGLEFPIVFLAALHKGVKSELAPVEFSRHYGLGARWVNPITRKPKDDLHHHAIREERKRRELEESNRLLYVAMTRAEDHLVLSYSGSGRKPEHWSKVVTESLGLMLDAPRDEVVEMRAPDGERWNLRVVCAAAAPAVTAAPAAAQLVPVELVERATAAAQHDASATVTDLAEFTACPRRYYLGRYLGYDGRFAQVASDAVADGLSAAELGTQVHAILAGNPPPAPDAEAETLAAAFRDSPLGRRAARATRSGREAAFLMAVGETVLYGQIDLWFEEGGEVVLVDYKTDSVSVHEAHSRALDYGIQVRLYAMALERLIGRAPGRAYLSFLRPSTTVAIDLAPSLLDSPEQAVADLERAQSTLDFPLREGTHCRRCGFYHGLCPAR